MAIQPFNIINSETLNIWKDIFTPLKQRKGYFNNTQSILIPIFFYRIIGIDNEESYYNKIYDFDIDLSNKLEQKYIKITEGFSIEYSNYVKKNYDQAWDKISFYNRKKPEFVMSILRPAKVFPVYPNINLTNQLEYAFQIILTLLINNNNEKDLKDLHDIVFDILCYCHKYIHKIFNNTFEYEGINPKLLYYGDITEKEYYFLILLQQMTTDVIYINSYSDCNYKAIDPNNDYSKIIEYAKCVHLKPFPISKYQIGSTTIAYEASQEIQNMLFTTEGGFYKPWQFSDYLVNRVHLKTTYEEIYILGTQQAMFRPDFKIDRFHIIIPTLFTKISGTHENLKNYWKEIHTLVEKPNAALIKDFPITTSFEEIPNKTISYEAAIYQNLLENNKIKINPDKLMQSPVWKYSHLRIGLQKLLANKISDCCSNLSFFKVKTHSLETRIKIFKMLLNIDSIYLNMLQKFDYPYDIPKLILYTKDYTLIFEEIILLSFFNSLGMDIIIYCPTGYSDIENHFEPGSYDIHRLKEFKMNLIFKPYKENIISKLKFFR